MDARQAQEHVNYLEERFIQPMMKAKAVIAAASEIAITLSQRQEQLEKIQADIETIALKKRDAEHGLEAMKANLTQQRADLQTVMQQDRQMRQKALDDHASEKATFHEKIDAERAKLEQVKLERIKAEQELFTLKAMIGDRLDALQEMRK